MQMHRDRHNDSMHGTNPTFVIHHQFPRNHWNHRLLLSVTPRRANDVPRRYHLSKGLRRLWIGFGPLCIRLTIVIADSLWNRFVARTPQGHTTSHDAYS